MHNQGSKYLIQHNIACFYSNIMKYNPNDLENLGKKCVLLFITKCFFFKSEMRELIHSLSKLFANKVSLNKLINACDTRFLIFLKIFFKFTEHKCFSYLGTLKIA